MVTVMVTACPHALGVAIPLVVAISTAISDQKGLLIRNRTAFEEARKITAMVFDKTGTLTEGEFSVTRIKMLADRKDEATLLGMTAALEQQSQHPIAQGIVREAQKRNVALPAISGFQSITGKGVSATVNGKSVVVVSPGYLKDKGIELPLDATGSEAETVVFVLISDQLKTCFGLRVMDMQSGLVNGVQPLKMRWVMVGLAFLATVLNYVHRLSFNYLSADGDLRKLIPDDAFGYIGTAFFVAYMISTAFSGFVIDRLGTRIGYALCMAFWTSAGLIHAFAVTPLQFGVCRCLLGIGEAGNWPAAIKLTSEWFPPNERSTASGIFNSGSALGAVIVPPMVAYLGVQYGWQATFIILAVFGYLWLAIFWFTYYTPEATTKEAKARIIPPLKLLTTRFVIMFTLSKTFMDPVWYFVIFWIARYLVDVHHWDLKQIGWYATIPFIIADVGNLVGGYFTQYIIKRGVPKGP